MSSSGHLWGFPLLHTHTVKTLDEVVQHLGFFTGLYGKAVTTRVTNHSPSRCTQAIEKKERWRLVKTH